MVIMVLLCRIPYGTTGIPKGRPRIGLLPLEPNTVFTLHKLNRSYRSTTVLGASVNAFLPFCPVPFRSVPLKNGMVKFAVRERSERSFSFIAISSV